ncbi:solute carrier family 25 member 40-like [Tropilaelaps mercedesae]|uniref:Solute carrier family 25 member 40-like n=1 Tax=Tropilaelaps mercedesae TaxID=418985 RepID=A0A1V9XX96_9ACAR|nr:solute carrier family 25 member 40-like [Tropilaelaps mercedesae]
MLSSDYLYKLVNKRMSDGDVLRDISPWQRVLASSSGAVITAVFMTPLDVVKVRLQSQQKTLFRSGCFSTCSRLLVDCACLGGEAGSQRAQWAQLLQQQPRHHHHHSAGHQFNDHHKRFKGTADALLGIARREGLGALWSGLPPTLIMAVPATVIYFTTYDTIKGKLIRNQAFDSTVGVAASSGASARLVTATCISPLELFRTKLQSQKISYVQLIQAMREMVAAKGIGSLYLGLSSTLLRDVPFSCIYWAFYESFKKSFVPDGGNPQLSFCLCAGAIAGIAAAVVTLPFDVVKTYRQIELGEKMFRPQESRLHVSGPFAMLADIYRKRGPQGLFAGIVPRIVKIAPACAIMISTYEMLKNFFLSQATYNIQQPQHKKQNT